MNPVEEMSQLFIDGELGLSWSLLNSLLETDTTSTEVYGFLSDTMDNVLELWEMNRATVADEYVAAAVCKSMIATYYYQKVEKIHTHSNLSLPAAVKPRVMLLSMRNEDHAVGGIMTSFLFREFGWEACCIESNVSMDYICQYAERWKPDVIGFTTSLVSIFQLLLNTSRNCRICHFPQLLCLAENRQVILMSIITALQTPW